MEHKNLPRELPPGEQQQTLEKIMLARNWRERSGLQKSMMTSGEGLRKVRGLEVCGEKHLPAIKAERQRSNSTKTRRKHKTDSQGLSGAAVGSCGPRWLRTAGG